MDEGMGKIKRTAKRVGDTAAEFEEKAEPVIDTGLRLLTRSKYTVRIILGVLLLASIAWLVL